MELLSLIVAAFSVVVAVVSVVFSIITYRKAVVHDRNTNVSSWAIKPVLQKDEF